MKNDGPAQSPFDEDDNRPITLPSDESQIGSVHKPDERAPRAKASPWWAISLTVLAICCLFLVFLFGWSALTTTAMITSTPTPNTTATQQIIQTATAQIFQTTATTAADKWPILLSDTFDSNKNNWNVDTTDNEYSQITREIKDGKYRWDATAHKGFMGWILIDTKALTDFYITTEAAQVSGSASADYGLIFRADPNGNLYYFRINKDRQFSFQRLYNNEWSELTGWTFSSAILQEQPNRLTVIANGDDFIVFINDQFVVEIRDDEIKNGQTALAVGLGLADAQATFEFDNVEIRVPEP